MDLKKYWEDAEVSPEQAKSVEEQIGEFLAKHASSEADGNPSNAFYEAAFKEINQDLAELVQKLQKRCSPTYVLPYFTTYFSQRSGQEHVGLSNHDEPCSIEALVRARVMLRRIRDECEDLVRFYRGYDEYEERFRKLRVQVGELGGDLVCERPVFRVTLPSERDPLAQETYTLHGCQFTYDILCKRLQTLRNKCRHLLGTPLTTETAE